jgi:hypothetical protein
LTHLSRPLFKYFGSKWNLAKHYPEPLFDTIYELTCGHPSYSCHYPEKQIVLVDKDQSVVDLLSWLIEADPKEIMSLPVTELVQGQDLRTIGLRPEAAQLIARWQRTGNNTCMTVSKWNNMPGMWQESVKVALAENVQRIRHWKVFQGDYDMPLNDHVTKFIDPPYQRVKGYPFDCRQMDYNRLSEFCRSQNGQVIVCEQEGADWLPFRPFRMHTGARTKQGGTRQKKQEVIWTKGCYGTL